MQIDMVGQCVNGVRRGNHVVGVAAATLRQVARTQQHLLADGKPLHAGPERGNAARDVIAGIGRQRRHPFVDATPDQRVGLPDPERLGPDLHLPGARHGHRKLDQFECIRPTRLTHQHRPHDFASPPQTAFSKIILFTKIIARRSLREDIS
ncbi:hypothetical protein ABIE71_004671 [Bradyrhizobium diazoefficiens]